MGLLELLGLKPKGSQPKPGSAGGTGPAPGDAAAPPAPSQRDEARKPLTAILTQITAPVLGGIDDDDARNRINAELINRKQWQALREEIASEPFVDMNRLLLAD